MPMQMLTKIVDWLQRPKIRKLLCFVSCVVGLVFYAVSSSFHHLFGKWIWWKILLYTLFCFFFMLFVVWSGFTSRRSISNWSKVHTAILVLLITSVYSYFVDKKVNAKPDAYSLVSCAAFAIMSLGLSTLSHLGFEVDLLYFFTATLTIQFMKIKLWLVIPGGGFMYFLVNLRSTLDSPLRSGSPVPQGQDHVAIDIDNSHSQLTRLRGSEVDSPQEVDVRPENEDARFPVSHVDLPQEVDSHLENEDERLLVSDGDSSQQDDVVPLENEQVNSDDIMAQFMSCIEALKNKNSSVINTVLMYVKVKNSRGNRVNDENQIPWEKWHRDDNLVADSLPSEIIEDLVKSAKFLFKTRLQEICEREYCSWRGEFLDMILLKFASPNLKMEDIDNTEKIERWLETFTVAVTILFPSEERLYQRVFGHGRYGRESPLTKVCNDLASSLLSTCYALATWSRFIPTQLEKLMKQLEFDFHFLLTESLTDKATSVRGILGYFGQLKSLINDDTAQATIDGGIHSITRAVMDYIRKTFIQKDGILGRCFEEYAMAAKQGKLSPSSHLARIIDLLESNLEATCKNYRTSSLGYVFIINNRTFIAREAQLRGLEHIIGYDWLEANELKIEKNVQLYLTSSWADILNSLNLDFNDSEANDVLTDVNDSDPNDVKAALMLCNLISFYKHLEDTCNDQAPRFIFDDKLKDRIITSIGDRLLPTYGKFIKRLQDLLGKHAYNHIKLGIRDVEDGLNKLFLLGADESDAGRNEKKNV